MFVKIIEGNVSRLFECQSVCTRPLESSEDKSLNSVIVGIIYDDGRGCPMEHKVSVACTKENAVFIMSDSGKTVDCIRYS